MSTPKVWFITGSSSGFGRHVTELVLKKGNIAIATLRNPSALDELLVTYPADRLLIVKLDVTKPSEIQAAFADGIKQFGRIDIVFNNAGYGLIAEVESTPEDVARSLYEVTFWGAANVTKEAVRIFREVNVPPGGRLLQNSSMAAIQGVAVLGFYTASKKAFEGLSEALAAELDPEWNIKITCTEAGGFRTDIMQNMDIPPAHPAYTTATLQGSAVRKAIQEQPLTVAKGDVKKAAEAIYKVATLAVPPLHFPLGQDAVEAAKRKLAQLREEIELSEPYSRNINVDE